MKSERKYIRAINWMIVVIISQFSLPSNLLAENIGSDDNLGSLFKVGNIILFLLILLTLWLIIVYSEKNDEGNLFLAPLRKLKHYLTLSTPLEKEEDILLGHDYDGIRELDNKIPPWFTILFNLTIVFAIIYMFHYHVLNSGDVQREEYLAEMSIAQAERDFLIRSGAFVNEETVTQLDDAGSINSGRDIYVKNCASCHGMSGEGLIGPNMTDAYWVHGGGIINLFKVIKYGVPQKGMISWQTQLDPKKMQEVASFILTLEGTNPANGKAPEGEKYEPEADEEQEPIN